MQILEKTQLEKLPTARLLALYRKTRKNRDSAYAWVTDYGTMPEALKEDSEEVRHCIQLDKYCDEMKSILDTKENVERKEK